MANADPESAGEGALERGDLHGGNRDVAKGHGEHADAHDDPGAAGECDGRGGEPAVKEAVLPEPELVQTDIVGHPGRVGQCLGRVVRTEHTPRAD
jgi:hypothetical protein